MQVLLLTTALIASFIPQRIVYEYIPSAHAAVIVRDAEPDPIVEEEIEVLENATSSVYCSCMTYLQSRGIKTRGDAIEQVPNWFNPPVRGLVVLLHYRDKFTGELIGHAALIENVFFGEMLIAEANFTKCEKSQRRIPLDSAHIVGYMKI